MASEPDPSDPCEPEQPRKLGQSGQPIRAIAFSSGGLDSAMQLGVVHALLTIQGKAPDVVVGVSAGAVNAVALAEVMQAGDDPRLYEGLEADEASGVRTSQSRLSGKDSDSFQRAAELRQRARVFRFREFLEAYLTSPTELVRAFAPDTLQVEGGKPLEPLKLPIHSKEERKGREKEVLAHQGLINLYNDLLGVRISFATITRFIRRYLGWQAAGELRTRTARVLAKAFELGRIWSLTAVNLPRAAWLVPPLLPPLLSRRVRPKRQDSTAAGIIFTARWWRSLRRAIRYFTNLTILLSIWLVLTVTILAAPYVVARIISEALRLLGYLGSSVASSGALWIDTHRIEMWLGSYAIALVAVAVLLTSTGAWAELKSHNRASSWGIIKETTIEAVGLLALLTLLLLPPLAAAVVITALALGLPLRLAFPPALEAVKGLYWVSLAVLAATALFLRYRQTEDTYVRRLLARYDLAKGLLSVHPLRELFVRLIDPDYYGERQMDDVVDRGLRDDNAPADLGSGRCTVLDDYEAGNPRIAVGLMVANLAGLREDPEEGRLDRDVVEVVPGDSKVIDALLAATAVTPMFPPVPIRDKMFIDGANVATEANRGVLNLLRTRANEESTAVHLYSVSPLPFSRPALREDDANSGEGPEFRKLYDVVKRALLLKRFQDASLERRLTELVTKAIPPGRAVYQVEPATADPGRDATVASGLERYLRVWVTPVEPEEPLELNHRFFETESAEQSRELLLKSIADGCRASLEVMIRESLDGNQPKVSYLPCKDAVAKYLKSRQLEWDLPTIGPGKDDNVKSPGPGLPEVCQHCQLSHAWAARNKWDKTKDRPEASLAINPYQEVGPPWPHEYEKEDEAGKDPGDPGGQVQDRHFVSAESHTTDRDKQLLMQLQGWPRDTDLGKAKSRPLVNLLFSGGVFRGVYQLGTLSALAEAGLERPDTIAGASVGSITGAMVAHMFATEPGQKRDARLARLAATYLTIDRLVLTDRFADFIRGVTLRAASTRFSLRQADRFMRRFDQPGSLTFSQEARTVMAGLERLFWLSPFELKDLVAAARLRKGSRVYELLREHLQEWLERMGVGSQILGAEPLELLIKEHVLQRLHGEWDLDPSIVPFDRYLRSGMYLLATATNLTTGQLEILGEKRAGPGREDATLLEGLLASSAFPGVFRPRWSWEVMPGTHRREQYIDGGVMDNLPLDAVAHFLRQAHDAGLIAGRPVVERQSVPHLLLAASLEINSVPPTPEELDRYLTEWPAVWKRARQLKYNKKVELFAETQRALRAIYQTAKMWRPMDLEVVTVRPRWLCGTFAFHPMLGFRRDKQAASIAHGCATTLLELGRIARDTPSWLSGWGFNASKVPPDPPESDRDKIRPGPAHSGHCVFRPGIVCPFAMKRLSKTGLPAHTIQELNRIYHACGRPETHQPG